MNQILAENNNLHSCDRCDKSFKLSRFLTRHNIMVHGDINTKAQTNGPKRKTKRKKKASTKKYCIICCKTFSTVGGYKCHMKKYHDGVNINNQTSGPDPYTWKKNNSTISFNVFKHFENEIPQELKDDAFRCKICNYIFPNNAQFMEHEKKHFEMHASDSEEVSFMKLEITNKGSDINPKYYYEIVNEITCGTCLSKFKSVTKHEEHEQICATNMAKDFESLRLSNPKLTDVDETKAIALTENICIFPKDTGTRSKDHLKALFEFQSNQRKFDCEICGKGCESLKHLEYHQWWNPS